MRFRKVFLSFLFANLFLGFHAHADVSSFQYEGRTYNVRVMKADSNFFLEAVDMLRSALSEHPTTIKTISACEKVVHVPVGFVNGNHSYGGLCSAEHDGKRIRIMICADEMVGHNVVQFGAKFVSQKELTEFVIRHCYGG